MTSTTMRLKLSKDGLLDVVTGNRSQIHYATCGLERHYWDSVTVLPGLGTGAFGAPATFRLDTDVLNSKYVQSHNAGWSDAAQ